MSTPTTSIRAGAAGLSVGTRTLAAILFVAGAALVYTVGFANSAMLHQAAHDSRHSLAFPCH